MIDYSVKVKEMDMLYLKLLWKCRSERCEMK